jgi:raffinose/stachyose/melibiose transport system permease protein
LRKNYLWISLFVLPASLVMGVFMLAPAFAAIGYSLFEWNTFTRGSFIGFDNFERLLSPAHRGTFLSALGNNVVTFVAVLLLQNTLALALAFALYRRPFGYRFFRGTIFLPVILSLIITAYLWELFLHPLFGPLTKLAMGTFGLESFAPLGDVDLALPTAIVISIWRNIGFPTLVFLAGMNTIPDDLFKAARLDGANEWQVFRNVMLPLLGPSMSVVMILSFIGAMEWFDLPYVIGGPTGNPGNSLDTMALMFYRLSFGDGSAAVTDVGLGSAVSVVLLVIVLAGAQLGNNYLRKREVKL